jgi:hypothetical protein
MLKDRLIAAVAIATTALFVTSAGAAETVETVVAKSGPATEDSAAVNRNLAKEANTAAAEDAIEAVLNATRLHLDIRLNGRTSGRTSEELLSGR